MDLSRLENLGRVRAFDSPGSSPVTTPSAPLDGREPDERPPGSAADGTPPRAARPRAPGFLGSAREGDCEGVFADARCGVSVRTAPVALDGFIAAMEWVLSHEKTGPRGYFAPGAGRVSKAEKAAAAARAAERTAMHIQRDSPARVRTEKLCEKRQRKLGVSGSAPIYEKLIAEGRRNEQKLEALAKQLEEEALAECTFQPAMRKSAELYRAKG